MNTTQAISVMERARRIAKDGYWFTGFTLVFMIVEFVVVIIYLVYLCSNRQPGNRQSSYSVPSAPPADQNQELEL
jgi:heme/copper-type cytochrome/quinol oxidase subunit 2